MTTPTGQQNGIIATRSPKDGEKPQVLLVSMPFAPLFQPSIGLGLLKAGLVAQGFSAQVLYFTLQFAERIGTLRYLQIANGFPTVPALVGEWIFSEALFGADRLDQDGYLNDVLRQRSPAHFRTTLDLKAEAEEPTEAFIAAVLEMRQQVEPFLDTCLQQVLELNPAIVAFTSVFQQQVAALALARRIKAHLPDTVILLGGANCEGIMGIETVRQFPFVDATISGEGDIILPQVVRRILGQQAIADLAGVHTRDNAEQTAANLHRLNAPSVQDMDSLPYPDYEDFFAQFAASRANLDQVFQPHLLFESSRGCWWGEKNHCTFCGLNGVSMAFRSKSADRALTELTYLTEQYPNCKVGVVDNILDMKYFKDFVPALGHQKLNLNELLYEVKVNLRKEHVCLLREAGITTIQPGVESLSNPVLEIMRKGVKCLQNVQLLKWCKELGVTPIWNILWGFAGEPPEAYEQMAALIPRLTHLEPPASAGSLRLDRFSPNFNHPEQFGFTAVEPYPSYHYVYPLEREAVANLAYHFTFQYLQPQDVEGYTQPLREQLRLWQEHHSSSLLFSVDKGSHLLIWDLRSTADQPLQILTGELRLLYLACDSIQTRHQLQAHQLQALAAPADQTGSGSIADQLRPLVDTGLMLQDGDSYLSLAVPLGVYAPTRAQLKPFQAIVKSIGRMEDGQVIIPVPVAAPCPSPAEPLDPFRLTPAYFTLTAGELRVNLAAIDLIEFNFVKLQLAGLQIPPLLRRSS